MNLSGLLCSLFQLYIVSVQTETRHLYELYITNAEFWKVALNPQKLNTLSFHVFPCH